ncbi:MAG: hypothetical protein ACYS8I_12260, partial [Planctomycetota bacterium]
IINPAAIAIGRVSVEGTVDQCRIGRNCHCFHVDHAAAVGVSGPVGISPRDDEAIEHGGFVRAATGDYVITVVRSRGLAHEVRGGEYLQIVAVEITAEDRQVRSWVSLVARGLCADKTAIDADPTSELECAATQISLPGSATARATCKSVYASAQLVPSPTPAASACTYKTL